MGKGGNKDSFRALFQGNPLIPNEFSGFLPTGIITRLLKMG
jgi:hypothetical protein